MNIFKSIFGGKKKNKVINKLPEDHRPLSKNGKIDTTVVDPTYPKYVTAAEQRQALKDVVEGF